MHKVSNCPGHVAIIMDGNGRWASERNHPRFWGHVRGSQIVSQIVEEADECGVRSLTLYAFSTENWSRPSVEISVLFRLLNKFLKKEKSRIIANNVSFKVIGDSSQLPKETKNLISSLESQTSNNKGLKLTFAFGYGGRKEIVDSVNAFIASNPGRNISEESLEQCLYRPEVGDVDLLIRTGGDYRISNYLLWQIAYAELFFTETKWPDFSREEFRKIVEITSKRERRFGMISQAESLSVSQKKASENIERLKNT